MLVRFHFRSRSFLTRRANAETDLLFFGTHLDDFEIMFLTGFEMQGLAVPIGGLRIVAQSFYALCNLHKRAEGRHAQDFAMNNVAHVMMLKKRLPDVRLKLLYSE